jgi:hypothetical protein
MDAIADRHADQAVSSVFIYTREAHPGENYRHHTDMDVKRHHARVLRDDTGIKRRILLDDLEGTVHQAYGCLPNMTWIFGRGGLVMYKAAWTTPEDVEASLDYAIDGLERRVKGAKLPFYSERLSWRVRDDDSFRSHLERCGPQAVSDFFDKRPKGS